MKLLIQPYADSILRAIKEVQSIEHNFDNGIDKINFSIILHGVLKLKFLRENNLFWLIIVIFLYHCLME